LKAGTIGALCLAAALVPLAPPRAHAQRATENAVSAASDAFGVSVGNEHIGLYSNFDVRGFSPILAGNARIDGLYFDQVSRLNSRVRESSSIRVGIAAQGYAFPAPTGVVDYVLRVPDGAAHLSSLTEIDTRGMASVEFDGSTPVIENKLSIGAGVGLFRPVDGSGYSNYMVGVGALARWTPAPGLAITPFWSRSDLYDGHTQENYVPGGAFLPAPNPGRHFFGPSWAINREFDNNFGVLVRYDFAQDWTLRAGAFRSLGRRPRNIYLEVDSLTALGAGELNATSDPPSVWASTSGEVRLEHRFATGPLTHRAMLSFRLRDYNALYGGSDTADLGPVAIGRRIDVVQPAFVYSEQTRDHIGEMRPGFTYQLAWKDVGTLGFGAQKPIYRKRTLAPGTPTTVIDAEPLLLSASMTANLWRGAILFADYTQGLEDNGLAPQNATNSNQALPAIATEQREAGVRIPLAADIDMVAGYFDIQKPYFNLDSTSLYTQLGQIDNQGLELSLSGNLLPRLDVVAGALWSEPKVEGQGVMLGLVGHRPVGIASQRYDVNANWNPPGFDDVTLGFEVSHQSNFASVLSGPVSVPERTLVNADLRYQLALGGHPASLRLWLENILAKRSWDISDAGTYDIYGDSGRHVDLRLIVDM
jgi:iron complex outermembrane recepter protein